MNQTARVPRLLLVVTCCVALLATMLSLGAPQASAVDAAALVSYQPAAVVGGVPDSSGLNAGDCALVIQMTGTIADGLGTYEILDPANSTPTRTYSSTEAVQFVVLSGGCDQNLEINATYSPPAWDGSTGGVVFLGGNTLTLNADIDASATGFRSDDMIGAGCDGADGAQNPDEPNGYIFDGTGGGGGIFGGGGGGGGNNGARVTQQADSGPSTAGTITDGGLGGANDTFHQQISGSGGDGGDPGCVGQGGSSLGAADTTFAGRQPGAGAGGGGSYGGGGGGCAASSSSAYSSGGSGGGSWTGGGAGGYGGLNNGEIGPNPNGGFGNQPSPMAVSEGDHYLNNTDPRLMMGGAGGASFTSQNGFMEAGGTGGGIVVLAFDDVVGNGNQIVSNGGNGATPDNSITDGGTVFNQGSSGSGGGAGGQMLISTTIGGEDFNVAANGGRGGPAITSDPNTLQSAFGGHSGSAGAGGGAGGIWFEGAGPADSNTGTNNGATSASSAVTLGSLTNVTWQVVSGGVGAAQGPVTIGTQSFPAADWMVIYNEVGQYSLANGVVMLDAFAAVYPEFAPADLLAVYPDLARPDNPKNAGAGCTPGEGGNGLVVISEPLIPEISIEKATNGVDSDEAPGETLTVGQEVVWTYVVTVSGEGTLDSVTVTDSIIDAADIDCESSGSNVVANVVAPTTLTCTATGIAIEGAYMNMGTAIGEFGGEPLPPVEDPSHYTGVGPPSIDIVKTVTGTPDGQTASVVEGQAVSWTFVVTNDGGSTLENVTITDPVLDALGVAVICDWANSSDPATPADVLSSDEELTCTALSDAGADALTNTAGVTGDPVGGGDPVDDEDPADYIVGVPAIEVVKTTCTDQADIPATCSDGPTIAVGEALAWLYEIENTGEVVLVGVTLGDDIEAGVDASVCDWANSSDPATGPNVLSIGETVSCVQNGVATASQYDNVGDVSAIPGTPDGQPFVDQSGETLDPVTDEDPSSYFGMSMPAIDIEKDTNGNQADAIADQDLILAGDPVVWTFVVENTGNVDLANVVVTDTVTIDNGTAEDPAGVVCDWANSSDPTTPAGNLSVGEMLTCASSSIAQIGQYGNNASVVGTPVDDATSDTPVPLTDANGDSLDEVSDEDPSHYLGPILDLALRKRFADGSNDKQASFGDEVTYAIEVFNQGNVHATAIEVTDYVPNGLAVVDDDWDEDGGIATHVLSDVILAPGDSVVVEITMQIIGNANSDYENEAEISSMTGVAVDGAPLLAADGTVITLVDIDSTPDANNSEDPVDDALNNEDGDEDDHDRTGGITFISPPNQPVTTASPPVPYPVITPPTPTPSISTTIVSTPDPVPSLALTGNNSNELVALAMGVIYLGSLFVIVNRRKDGDNPDA